MTKKQAAFFRIASEIDDILIAHGVEIDKDHSERGETIYMVINDLVQLVQREKERYRLRDG